MTNKHPNLIKIGQLIKSARSAQDLSQEELAAEARLGRTYVGRIERGEQNISIQNLIVIAKTLGKEISELVPPIDKLDWPS